jgi:hypothetical protein
MIRLQVEDYCQNCEEFKPETQVMSRGYVGMNSKVDTTIQCSNAKKCERLCEYLKKEGGNV